MRFHVLFASTESEIDAAFSDIVRDKTELLIIATDPFLLGQRDQVVGLAARYAVPTMYFLREFVEVGGLMSYGPDIAHGYRQAGVYTGRILERRQTRDPPGLAADPFSTASEREDR